MSFGLMRIAGIKTTDALRGVGKHHLDRISETNKDIDPVKKELNIHLIESNDSYLKNFFEITEPMKKEHDERMKTMRKDRVKSFEAKINSAKNDVACEFLFASDETFFEHKNEEEIKKWANDSLDFVLNEAGMKKEQIIHAVIHMDEKTPHFHVVAVPLVQAYDGRMKKEVWQLNRKKFIPDKEDLEKLQEAYYQKMTSNGHDFEKRVPAKESGRKHLSVEEFKQQTQYEAEKEIDSFKRDLDKQVETEKQRLKTEHAAVMGKFQDAHDAGQTASDIADRVKKDKFGRGPNIILPEEDYKVLMQNLVSYRDIEERKNKEIRELRTDLHDSRKETDNMAVRFDLVSRERDSYKNEAQKLKSENGRLGRELGNLRGIVNQMGAFMEKNYANGKELFQKVWDGAVERFENLKKSKQKNREMER